MTQPFIPYGRQQIDDDDIAAVTAVLRGDWLTTGPAVVAFEKALVAATGAHFAVANSNGTAALHMSLMALQLGPGDAIIAPSLTFLATANAARFVGAEVVFADVDAETGLMTAETLDAAFARTPNGLSVKAVLPVHLRGLPVDLPALKAVADRHSATLVEDAAHAIGARYISDNRLVAVGSCRESQMACFSFHPVKTIAMGEGGAVTTNDPALAERLRRARSHGMVNDPEHLTNR